MINISNSSGAPLRQPWKRGIAVGRAYELLRTDLIEHLRFLQREIGYEYCRFHALFHDDMGVVTRDANGRLHYRWHHVDKIYDALLELGLKPFVELNPMPEALASGTQKMFFYRMNVTPPASYEEWGELVENFGRHCVERYGLDEVRSWYFEVWNEPNLSGFWSGTQDEYWKLYEASAHALKRVDSRLRIGGPASSKAHWVSEIIEHCTQNTIPLDFVSTHLYPQDEYVEWTDRAGSPHEPGEFFSDTVRGVQTTVAKSARPDLEIHWTEWNTQSATSTAGITWGDNIYVDSQFAASFIARNCIALDETCDSLVWWVASDIFEEGGIPHAPFSCTYGMLTIHGIPKASFHAFALMNRLRGGRCELDVAANAPVGCGGVATRDGDLFHVLLWNHPPLEQSEKPVWRDSLSFPFTADSVVVSHALVGAGQGSAWETWCAMGRPENLSRAQEAALRAHAEPRWSVKSLASADGAVGLPFELGPYEIMYVEVRPAEPAAIAEVSAEFEAWDVAMGEKSR
ncbi:MAG TPA: hypothetical protein VF719_13415 [Abditibacteriaceae bacterium]|jgi:xylan 1,4-beta-xylosidase